MPKKTVYLAGPIGGKTKMEANGWRDTIQHRLKLHNIQGVSPLRCEPIINGVYDTLGDKEDKCFGTAQAIGSKNEFDVRSCDILLAYLPTLSMGTLIEIGMGKALAKPVIVVADDPEFLFHPVIQHCSSWSLHDLEDALDVIIGVLEDYT